MMVSKKQVSDRLKPILMKYWGWNKEMWELWRGSPLHQDIDLIAEKIEEKARQDERKLIKKWFINFGFSEITFDNVINEGLKKELKNDVKTT